MTRRDQLWEQYEDALFALLMEELAEEEGQRLLEENERLKNNSEAAIPEKVRRRCQKTICNAFTRKARRLVGRVAWKVFRQMAAVILIAILLFATAFAAIPEIRIRTLNLLIQVSDSFSALTLEKTNENISENSMGENNYEVNLPTILMGYRLPKLPEEFVLDEMIEDETITSAVYTNGTTKTIEFAVCKTNSPFNVDTENSTIEYIEIHGYEGMVIEKMNYVDIVWGDTEHGCIIGVYCTGVTREVALELAEGVIFSGT